MDSLKVVVDTIRVAVNQSCDCNKVGENSGSDIAVVAIIAGCSLLAVIVVCLLIFYIERMKKHDGIKAIVDKILEDKEKQDNKNGK